jgi:membrane associated rhomboid family serine protease
MVAHTIGPHRTIRPWPDRRPGGAPVVPGHGRAGSLIDSAEVPDDPIVTAPGSRDPFAAGPLDRASALGLIARADALAATGEYATAAPFYARVVGHADPELHVAALLGLGECQYRLDDDDGAVQAWTMATRAPETPLSWVAWRQIAATRVRQGDMRGALEAYREADRRAPSEARPEIASRLGWLSREVGDQRAASRYFGRSRSPMSAQPLVSYILIAVTAAISLAALYGGSVGDQFASLFILDKDAVARGEYWRLVTVTLLHGGVLHLAFNMYALYITGPLVERMYGRFQFLLVYVMCAIGGSVASFVFIREPSVGASGAIFGLFGVLFVALRVHHPLLDRRARALASQIGFLILFNLALGFGIAGGGIGAIDNFAHLGGLAAGGWLGLLLAPNAVGTLAGLWQRPAGQRAREGVTAGVPPGVRTTGAVRVVGVALLCVVLAAGIVFGTQLR